MLEMLISFGLDHTGFVEVAIPSLLVPVSGVKGQILAEDFEANSC